MGPVVSQPGSGVEALSPDAVWINCEQQFAALRARALHVLDDGRHGQGAHTSPLMFGVSREVPDLAALAVPGQCRAAVEDSVPAKGDLHGCPW